MMNRRLHTKTARPRQPWRLGLAAVATAGLIASAGAQTVDLYSFSSSTGTTLDPMTGATTLVGANQDDAASAVTNIGFNFMYEGTAYTQFSVNSNGAMRLGPTAVQAYSVDNINDANNNPKIIPFSADGTTGSGSITTVLTGSSPNQIRVIQWNVGVNYNENTPNCTYQVWLYETTGVIEFRYGTGAPTGSATYFWTGISGASGSNYMNVRPGPVGSNSDITRLQAWPGNGNIFTFTPPAACTGTPAPGNTVVAGLTSGCPGYSTSLSLQNNTPGSAVTYQWESSPDNITWTAIGGAITANYNTGSLLTSTWFRCAVTCGTGPSTGYSTPVQIIISSPSPTYDIYSGTQINEDFSSWGNRCSTTDVPSATNNHWINSPAYGPGTWRRNDQGASAGWNNTSGYFYGDGNGAVAPAARFHSRQGGSAVGTLDYYIDMSAGTGGEMLRFEYVNSFGSGTLQVLVSPDGGANFTSLGTLGASTSPPMNAPANSWIMREFVIGSTSATTVIRLKGTAAPSASGNDIGVDNFRIVPEPTCKKVTGVTASATGPNEATVSWTCTTCSGNYIIEYGPTGFTPGTQGTAGVNGTVVNASGSPAIISALPAGSYDVYVRENCGGGDYSENSTPKATFSIVAGDFCANAIDMTTLPLTDWSTIANNSGAAHNYTTSCASYAGGDVVLYYDVEAGATISFVLQASNSILSIAHGGSCPGTNVLACGSGSYLDLGPNVQLIDWYETFTWTNTGCSTERMYILDGAVSTGGVLYIANFSYTPAAGPVCQAVTGIAVSTVNTGSGANVSWNATCSGNVLVEYGPSGFTPGSGTSVAATGTGTSLSGLTFDAAYDVYVRQECGGGLFSAYGSPATFTVHNGDDCSRAMAMTGTSGSMTVSTTGANNDVAFCDVGDTGGDLILSATVQPGDGIYITSAPQAPYVGRVAVGAGSSCPGQTLLYCNAGAADFYWQNTTGTPVNVFVVQDGADEGTTTINWEMFTFAKVVVSITTDNNPGDITWEILDDSQTQVASGGPTSANTTVNETVTLPSDVGTPACYAFRIMDAFGDGIANGGWELRTTSGKLILRDSFASGSQSPSASPLSPSYGDGHSFCLPLGPANILDSECNIFTNELGNKVYCNKVTGATQYQFEFSDPDAGRIRRIVRNTNYVHFGDMVASPLLPGVKYFARVRTDVAGPVASAHFGSGCEMGITSVMPCSELIQAPAYGHSCSETRSFNTNNSFIYAKPVIGATEYQFHIFNANEGYDQTFVRSTYILQLKWNSNVAPPLINGSTYNVEINVKVSGAYSGFCPSSCTITIANSGNHPMTSMKSAGDQAAFNIWPNPNNGDRLNVALDGLDRSLAIVEARLLDLTGRTALTTSLPVADGRVNCVMDLHGTANGTYLLQMVAGSQTYTQRVVVSK
jgi:hypothetical protein